jgi:hypothetical protein
MPHPGSEWRKLSTAAGQEKISLAIITLAELKPTITHKKKG